MGLRFIKQLRSIAFLISLVLFLPAYFLEVWKDWQLIVLYIAYTCFLFGSVWNTIISGQVSQKKETKSVQSELGAITSLATAGLWLFHPIAIVDFVQWQSAKLLIDITSNYLNILSLLILFSSVVLIHLATRTLGKYFDRLILKEDHELITTGVYSVIRHPIYLAYLLLFSGCALLLQSLFGLILVIMLSSVVFGNHIRVEEAMLAKRFGNTYVKYQAKTKKIIPFVY